MAKKKAASSEAQEPNDTASNDDYDLEAIQRDYSAIIERHERKRASWLTRADKIVKLYADTDEEKINTAKRKYAVLWANVQVLCPATYSRAPKCVVSRRFQTPSQDVRNAVLALERVTNITIENAKLHDAIMSARLDRFLPGRGTIWIRYEAKDDGKQVTEQKVHVEHVDVKDFGHGEGRTYAELDCIWRKTYMSEDKLKTRFGDEVISRSNLSLDYSEKDAPEAEKQATVYEIWCKSKKTVYWLAKSAKKALEAGPPPLDLKNFFPFPKPVYATLTNKHCLPTPDYIYYQDQAEEITRLTKRIDRLTDSLKLVGFYPAGPSTEGRSEIERALTPGFENKLIPVASWAAFAEKGGVQQIQYLPIDMIVKIIESCVELRKQLLADIYQIMGLAEIMRGESDPRKTLGAQQLETQYGAMRLKDTKDDFIRFAAEACQIVAEIVAEHFTPETLGKLSQISPVQTDPATQQPILDQATGQPAVAPWVKLLRSQLAREVLIDVETDSTVQPDEDAEKARRTEFMTAFGVAMQPLMTLQEMQPQVAQAVLPLFGDLMTFVARGFRAGRELEERIEETLTSLGKIAGQQAQQAQANPPGNPDKIKADAEIAKAQEDAKAKAAEAQAKAATDQHKATLDAASEERAAARAHEIKTLTLAHQSRQLEQADKHHDATMVNEKQANDNEQSRYDQERNDKMQPIEDAKVEDEAVRADLDELKTGLAQLAPMVQMQLELAQQTLQTMKAPKRLVKDPKTGEKRVEVMN